MLRRYLVAFSVGCLFLTTGCSGDAPRQRVSDQGQSTTAPGPSAPGTSQSPFAAPNVALIYPDFVAPAGFAAPGVVAGFYVLPDIPKETAVAVARAAGFAGPLVDDDGEARWRTSEGNRVFQIDRRFGGQWVVRLVDPLCFSPEPCKPGAGVRSEQREAAPLAIGTRRLRELAEASQVELHNASVTSAPVGKLINLRAKVAMDGRPMNGVDFEVTVAASGTILFAGGIVGPFTKGPGVPAITLAKAIDEMKKRGVARTGKLTDAKTVVLESAEVNYLRQPGRGWGHGGMRPYDVVPVYEFLAADGRRFSVVAVDLPLAYVGGPAPKPTEETSRT